MHHSYIFFSTLEAYKQNNLLSDEEIIEIIQAGVWNGLRVSIKLIIGELK